MVAPREGGILPPRFFGVLALTLASCQGKESAQQAPPPPATAPVTAVAPASAAPAATSSSAATTPPVVPGPVCGDLVKPPAAALPKPTGKRARGVDASMPVAWKSLKDQGIAFAFAQALYGTTPNKSFAANWAMMKSCGLARGAYDFITPAASGASQAQLFLQTVGDDLGELGPFVDVERPANCKSKCCEVSCDGWTTVVADWISTVTKATGRKPVVYTVEDFWKECVCNKSRFALHDLWLAGYPRFDFPDRPGFGGWQKWLFYQHAGNVRFGDGVVDLNVFRGTDAEFVAWLAARQRK